MRRAILSTALLTMPGVLAAQNTDSVSPRIENARLEKRAVTEPLVAAVKRWTDQAAQPQWLGYAVPQVGGDRTACCGNYSDSGGNGCATCRLETDHNEGSTTSHEP